MIAFRITYSSDKKVYSFKELSKFTSSLASLFPDRYFPAEPVLTRSNQEEAPDYSCIRNHCWHLPEKYLHTYELRFRCKNLNDILLLAGIYQNTCALLGYTFEFVSLRDV